MSKLKAGDEVMVIDSGLMALQQFMPKGSRPSFYGWVDEFYEDGTILVKFPIGDDDPDEHSQVAPYPKSQVHKKQWTNEHPIKSKQ